VVYEVAALAVERTGGPFRTVALERRDLGPSDIRIDIAYAGICHSDLHHVAAEWGRSTFPMVPGHEIAGVVAEIGSDVTAFTVGDSAGVGCLVGSCGRCDACVRGLEQYCERDVLTYDDVDADGFRTFGGYSESIVVDEKFAVAIPPGMPLAQTAPLMCAGITLYSPLRRWSAAPGKRVGIVGFGGLGHIGVQISHALGAHTTVLNLARDRADDAFRLGADAYEWSADPDVFERLAGTFDLVISTVPANLDLDAHLRLLRVDGTFVNLGVPSAPLTVAAPSLLRNRRSIAGSLIGGLGETQEMIEFCAAHAIGAEVEIVSAAGVADAYRRVERGDVRYRFVIDVATIAAGDRSILRDLPRLSLTRSTP
jgi:alcohol dehydrogenase (NADP+)